MIKVLFEDAHLCVLNKPAGLLSQGDASQNQSLVDELKKMWKQTFVGLVHRLDRNTSGLMVVAKTPAVAAKLTSMLQAGKIERVYLAWLKGTLRAPARWEHFVVKDEKNNQVRVVKAGSSQAGKAASLRVEPVESAVWWGYPVTLCEFTLETGRSHQIRVQAAEEGFPLLGDEKYGRTPEFESRFGRPALHSHHIEFVHPITSERISIILPMPEDMAAVRAS